MNAQFDALRTCIVIRSSLIFSARAPRLQVIVTLFSTKHLIDFIHGIMEHAATLITSVIDKLCR